MGAEYDFMLVLDADSLMTAETIVKMARLMEANPHAGIIQASPQMVNSTSMFARMQQFAGKVAGPVVGAGLAYWQAGNSNYWGITRLSARGRLSTAAGCRNSKAKDRSAALS